MLKTKYYKSTANVPSGPVQHRSVKRSRLSITPTAIVCCITALVVAGGCEQSGTVTIKRDEVQQSNIVRNSGRPDILLVGGETITYEEIVNIPFEQGAAPNAAPVSLLERLKQAAQTVSLEEFKQLARPVIEQQVRSQISGILLYQDARRHIEKDVDPALEKAAEKEWRRFVMRYDGDEAKAEESLKQTGMSREVFKERKKKAILIQYYASLTLTDKPVTYSELVETYNQMKGEVFVNPAALTFRLIDIETAKVNVADPNQDPLARARELAGQLMERIRAGEDFGELAKKYSNDHRREFGGLWKPKNPKSLAEPYNILASQAEKMEAGQVTGPIETAGHIFIMKLEEKQVETYEPLEDVQNKVRERVIADRQQKALEMLNEKVKEQASVIKTDGFIDYCLERVYTAGKQ
jgi:parvulin-like peptidyl-prolyl isomerase